MSVKMGRPTNDPKKERVAVRLNEKSYHILEQYVKQEGVTIGEAIRRGILKLEADIKKK